MNDIGITIGFLSRALVGSGVHRHFVRRTVAYTRLNRGDVRIIHIASCNMGRRKVPFCIVRCLGKRDLDGLVGTRPLPVPHFLNLVHRLYLKLRTTRRNVVLGDRARPVPVVRHSVGPDGVVVVRSPALKRLTGVLSFNVTGLVRDDDSRAGYFVNALTCTSPRRVSKHRLSKHSSVCDLNVVVFRVLAKRLPLQTDDRAFKN